MQNEQPRDKAAVRYAPREMLFPREIDRFLERAWIPWKATRRWRRPWMPDEWVPDTDVFDRDGKLVVRADLPGIKRQDLEVRVEGETLIVSGHREGEKEIQEKDYHYSERRTGAFTRTVVLPDGFSPDAINATYEDGVLEVTIPTPATAESRRVEIPVK
jgi:HSP20 family molecular chaperone IbpA